jgi:hypothetical protein
MMNNYKLQEAIFIWVIQMAAFSLITIAAIREYHIYKDSWEPGIGDEELEE